MHRILTTAFLLLLALARAMAADEAPAPEPSPAHKELQALLSRQNLLMAEAAVAKPGVDEARVQKDFQDLSFDFDAYLKRHPDLAEGYTAYGLLLWRLDMRRQAVALFLKSNKINPDQAVVKNQLGNFSAEEGRPLEAVNYFLAAIKLAPNEPLYHYQLGSLLHEARDDFLKSGEWTRESVEKAMFNAFRRAAELAPARIEFSYRQAESYYDLAKPDWEEALAKWQALEDKAEPGLPKETIRLHRANVRLRQGKPEAARELLATVTDPALAEQKEKLVAQLPENAKK